MKKIIGFLFIVMFIFSVCGCVWDFVINLFNWFGCFEIVEIIVEEVNLLILQECEFFLCCFEVEYVGILVVEFIMFRIECVVGGVIICVKGIVFI